MCFPDPFFYYYYSIKTAKIQDWRFARKSVITNTMVADGKEVFITGGMSMVEKNWLEMAMDQTQTVQLMETNQFTAQYGLTLCSKDTEVLLAERKAVLKEQKRVEFGEGILPRLIYAFCDSDYISQSNYAETLIRLQEIFYLYKNEMMDEVTDEELINFMKEQFETICYGDLDYLAGTCLDIFAQAVRSGYRDYHATSGCHEYSQFDEVKRWDKDLYQQVLKDLCWK